MRQQQSGVFVSRRRWVREVEVFVPLYCVDQIIILASTTLLNYFRDRHFAFRGSAAVTQDEASRT